LQISYRLAALAEIPSDGNNPLRMRLNHFYIIISLVMFNNDISQQSHMTTDNFFQSYIRLLLLFNNYNASS